MIAKESKNVQTFQLSSHQFTSLRRILRRTVNRHLEPFCYTTHWISPEDLRICHEGERQDKPKESVRGVNEEGKDEAESRI